MMSRTSCVLNVPCAGGVKTLSSTPLKPAEPSGQGDAFTRQVWNHCPLRPKVPMILGLAVITQHCRFTPHLKFESTPTPAHSLGPATLQGTPVLHCETPATGQPPG